MRANPRLRTLRAEGVVLFTACSSLVCRFRHDAKPREPAFWITLETERPSSLREISSGCTPGLHNLIRSCSSSGVHGAWLLARLRLKAGGLLIAWLRVKVPRVARVSNVVKQRDRCARGRMRGQNGIDTLRKEGAVKLAKGEHWIRHQVPA